jgi:predicted permease
MYNLRTERDRAPLSIPDVEDYRRESSTVAALAVFTNMTTNLTGVETPERLEGVRVSGNFFDVLGTSAHRGRLLQPEDEERGARVAVLTHGLWRRSFGGDDGIVGREISLHGANYTVVGILPPRFLFPFRDAELAIPTTLRTDARRSDRGANFLRVVARLKPEFGVTEAKTELNGIARRLQQRYPNENAKKTGISLYPLHGEIVRDYRTMLWTLFAAVAVVLVVGSINLANLLLVRAAGRRTEFALRMSLGASRGRVARQLVGEAMLLATLGGGFGLVLAFGGLALWRGFGPADFPQRSAIAIDATVVLFTISVSLATAVVCGVVPAWFAVSQPSLGAARTTTISRAQTTAQHAFVSIQTAAATVLLIAMLLMARGFARLERVDPGFTPAHAVAVPLSLPPARYGNRDALTHFYDALRDRLRAISSIESAGAVSQLPLSGLLTTVDIALLDRPAPQRSEVPQAHFRIATPEYFAAAGIRILAGRSFDARDTAIGQPVAIVSRTFADRHWPGAYAVGQSIRIIQEGEPPALEIVGIVEDVKQFTMDGTPTADLYLPLYQVPAFQAPATASRMNWVVRTRDDTASLAGQIRRAVAQVDPGVAASSVRTLESVWRSALSSKRANVRLLELFGVIALVLCATGVYAVTAFAARTRRRELAIRAALGASQKQLTTAVFRRELRPAAVGVAYGLLVAFVAAPRLFASVYGAGPRDAVTYVQIAAILLAVAACAIYLPTRRAANLDPAVVLGEG